MDVSLTLSATSKLYSLPTVCGPPIASSYVAANVFPGEQNSQRASVKVTATPEQEMGTQKGAQP